MRQLALELISPFLQSLGRPRYPSQQQQYQQRQQQPPPLPLRPASSDFTCDFYAAGSGSSATPGPSSAPTSPADARPTQAPTPGHPLLRDGCLLVYPKGFVCNKCASHTNSCEPTDARRQQHGLQACEPHAPVPEVLGALRKAVPGPARVCAHVPYGYIDVPAPASRLSHPDAAQCAASAAVLRATAAATTVSPYAVAIHPASTSLSSFLLAIPALAADFAGSARAPGPSVISCLITVSVRCMEALASIWIASIGL